jgi:uncharacterized protein (TIGR04222 family)
MFTLRGPEFLVLFATLAIVVFFAVHTWIVARETSLPSDRRVRDPYAIAYLRGDTRELIRVVALSLCIRKLLGIGKTTIQTVNEAEIDRVRLPIEKEFLRACRTPCQPLALPKVPEFKSAVDEYHRDLVARGLLASDEVKRARFFPVYAGILFLGAIAATKIYVALTTGHSNIAFLVMLAVLVIVLLRLRISVRRTPAGRDVLIKLRTLFASLRRRGAPTSLGDVSDAELLAAVFGIYGVAGLDNISWARLFPNPNSNSGSSGSGCGSSGGCGGGGGGCGGCGS